MMILQTERLILRPWSVDDAEELYRWAKDPKVGPIASWPVHRSVEESREIIKNVLSAKETYAVCPKDNNRPIGSVGINFKENSDLELKKGEGELGYWLGVPFWGNGIIPEACKELIRHAFEDLNLEKLWCASHKGNRNSERVKEKCGFVYCATSKDELQELTGEIVDINISCLEKRWWEKQ